MQVDCGCPVSQHAVYGCEIVQDLPNFRMVWSELDLSNCQSEFQVKMSASILASIHFDCGEIVQDAGNF